MHASQVRNGDEGAARAALKEKAAAKEALDKNGAKVWIYICGSICLHVDLYVDLSYVCQHDTSRSYMCTCYMCTSTPTVRLCYNVSQPVLHLQLPCACR